MTLLTLTSSVEMKLEVIILFSFLNFSCEFVVPDALVKVFEPSGLHVSIPDLKGITLFSFHGKINEPLKANEVGSLSKDITKSIFGRWTFFDSNIHLEIGDVLYYRISVHYLSGNNAKRYSKENQKFVLNQFSDPLNQLSCNLSTTVVNNQRVCGRRLVLDESFDDFKRNLWILEHKFAAKPDYEFVGYSNTRPDIFSIQEGYLKIHPIPSNDSLVTSKKEVNLGMRCTGIHGTTDCIQKSDAFIILPPVGSAQLTTRTKWSFKYGKIEIRAKFPKGDWIYPELYLNPANEFYGPDYASGQIRIGFVQGNTARNHFLQGGCILGGSTAGRNYAMRSTRKNKAWSDDFHIFSLLWKPDQITVAVDGEVYGNIYPPKGGFVSLGRDLSLENVDRWRKGTALAPFDREMYLVIGVGAGGHCFEDGIHGNKPWKNDDPKAQKKFYEAKSLWLRTWTDPALYVDYVKIWSL